MSEESNSYVVALQKYKDEGFFCASNKGEIAMWVNSDVNIATTGKYLYDHIRSWQPASCRFEILGLSIDPK
jgi:hypothetical protein